MVLYLGVSVGSGIIMLQGESDVSTVQAPSVSAEADSSSVGTSAEGIALSNSRSPRGRLIRIARRGVGVLLAIFLVLPQHRRYRLAEAHGLENGRLLKPALLAIVAGLVVEVVAFAVVTRLVGVDIL